MCLSLDNWAQPIVGDARIVQMHVYGTFGQRVAGKLAKQVLAARLGDDVSPELRY